MSEDNTRSGFEDAKRVKLEEEVTSAPAGEETSIPETQDQVVESSLAGASQAVETTPVPETQDQATLPLETEEEVVQVTENPTQAAEVTAETAENPTQFAEKFNQAEEEVVKAVEGIVKIAEGYA